MARLRGHRPLDAEQPLYVRRAVLTLNGTTFAAGDVLPWRDIGVTPRKLHQLWHSRLIAHEKADERNGAENPVELVIPIQASPAPTAPPAASVQPDLVPDVMIALPGVATQALADDIAAREIAAREIAARSRPVDSKHKRR